MKAKVHSLFNKRLEKAEQTHKELLDHILQIEAEMLRVYNQYVSLRAKLETARSEAEIFENKTKIGVIKYQNIKLKGK